MVYEDVKQLISHLINNVYQGIEEVDFNDFCSAELFPNPVSEYLTVRFISKESISKVKIFSVMGELKGEYSFRTPSPWEMYQFSIQVNDLPEGIYVLLLENKAYLFVRRND
ncbi:MAG TPA: T9SS type A sorting domain-containing protein [Salinivirgaceae bacterium]|nr:T9SS type A sorting domain-containing protein [Salinivirgaceae bacterium]